MVIGNALIPGMSDVERGIRTLSAAALIGVIGRVLSGRSEAPSAVYVVPAILPLLAESEAARQALQGQALETAFLIGVGVASGDILVAFYQQRRFRYAIRRSE